MSSNGFSHRHPLEVRVFGGTISCEEHEADDSRRGRRKRVLLPQPGKIRSLIENQVPDRVMSMVDLVAYSEADPIVDSAELNVGLLMQSVEDIRKRTRRGANLLIASGTDNVPYLMHALAEGVPREMLGDRNIIVVVSQTHAPADLPVTRYDESPPPACEPVDNLTNAIYLSTRDEMRGRIGLYCGGVLFPPRGLVKIDTKDPQPFHCRFDQMGISERPPQRDWHIVESEPAHLPRGMKHKYELADGIESWGFDPLSHYGNLPAAMEGMICRKQGGGLLEKSPRKTDFNAMVVQAPGSSNLRQSEEELACVNEAAEIGLEADVPVVLISDPLQPHSSGEDEGGRGGFIYGGDFALMREHLDKAAGGTEKSPVLSGGKLARPEAKLLVSQAVRRGVQVHGHHGKKLLEYVQLAFADYESYLAGRRR
ncbi:MAG: hypothetical protein UY85_C0018G0011 [Candidatus Peribacteria bacterium GW2011_GWB1_54_5]|nr:MAG: hypothetical protein UY85_C0018G0011 [Candidatus Peribacteria bacterium GW2011_GWB1_54_5]KKW40415.1 MAG: hypothetical protein UY87_C0023G0020 [Candidatus Peribacteria bacterium GW2011_GWC2_54_8]KKW42663.1 MAG: hypothetical protein UY90_C0035G0007 [Candidatus Peregrinibacteria bacterium GW2011_GWA2_54_9]